MDVFDDMELEKEIDIGNSVICDICGDDFSDSKECGGIIFKSNGVCPKCTPDMIESAKEYGEEKYIKAYCGPDQSFAEFILEARGGNNTIKIYGSK